MATLVVVDDGSWKSRREKPLKGGYSTFRRIALIALRRNLGHQRAVAIGLAAIHEQLRHDIVVVMDGDGEDRQEDVPRLFQETQLVQRKGNRFRGANSQIGRTRVRPQLSPV